MDILKKIKCSIWHRFHFSIISLTHEKWNEEEVNEAGILSYWEEHFNRIGFLAALSIVLRMNIKMQNCAV